MFLVLRSMRVYAAFILRSSIEPGGFVNSKLSTSNILVFKFLKFF